MVGAVGEKKSSMHIITVVLCEVTLIEGVKISV